MVKGTILVVGGGTMGRGIAGVCVLSGFSTAVYEADPAARRRLPGSLESSWKRSVERGKLAPQAVEEALNRLSLHDHLEDAAAGVELALEAVPESLELKREVFGQLDRLCPRSAILASNTSSLPIGELARATDRPDRVIGIHFFNPVAVMPLVEIVRARETSRETEEKAARFVAALAKEAIRVSDSPGFATSRLGLALGLEAMRMVEEGVASPSDIDKAMELGYGHRMGPLKTSDLVGLDVRLSIAQTLAARLSETRFRPPEILKRLVSEGCTGQKSGHGFYRWEGDTPVASATAVKRKT
ncbi:MAG: 3-hydroxyacyl-CoA dehydrogenase family protein [Thermoanaerobaculia bacterium]